MSDCPAGTKAILDEALSRHRDGAFDAALNGYRRLLRTSPDDPDLLFLAGSACHRLGRSGEALAMLRRAVALRDGFAAAHNNIGMVLAALGRHEAAAASYRQAVAADPDLAAAWTNLGGALQVLGDGEAAVRAFRAGVAAGPRSAEAHNNLAMALRDQGEAAGAEAGLRQALELSPGYALARFNLCSLLLEQGRPGEVGALCGDDHVRGPLAGGLLACRAVAARETGDAATAGRIMDLDTLVRDTRLPPPTGYADIAAFNRVLAGYAASHPSLVYEPSYQSTRHGSVTRDLLIGEPGPVALLRQLVEAAVADYDADLRRMFQAASHPVTAARPADLTYAAWAVVMERQGHQAPHIHPDGWLSAVYYVALPAVLGRGDGDHQGWIEFGRPPEAYRTGKDYPVRLVRPEAGMLLLFPSYVFHRTLPYDSDERRISIAFDVRPSPP